MFILQDLVVGPLHPALLLWFLKLNLLLGVWVLSQQLRFTPAPPLGTQVLVVIVHQEGMIGGSTGLPGALMW